jgi:hypothetical protein
MAWKFNDYYALLLIEHAKKYVILLLYTHSKLV